MFSQNAKKGFTLLEMLISIGILGILILAGISVSQLMTKSTEYGDTSQASTALQTMIRERLKFSELCDISMALLGKQNQSGISAANILAGNQQISFRIPGMRAGADGKQDVLRQGQVIPEMHLQVDDLRLVNAALVNGTTYIAQVRLQLSRTGGISLKPAIVGSTAFNLSGSSIVDCAGQSSSVTATICSDIGCTWDPEKTPACQCQRVVELCPPGEFPVRFTKEKPECRPLGGTCPAGQYLVQIGVGNVRCENLAAVTATTTTTIATTTTTLPVVTTTTTTIPPTTTTLLALPGCRVECVPRTSSRGDRGTLAGITNWQAATYPDQPTCCANNNGCNPSSGRLYRCTQCVSGGVAVWQKGYTTTSPSIFCP